MRPGDYEATDFVTQIQCGNSAIMALCNLLGGGVRPAPPARPKRCAPASDDSRQREKRAAKQAAQRQARRITRRHAR